MSRLAALALAAAAAGVLALAGAVEAEAQSSTEIEIIHVDSDTIQVASTGRYGTTYVRQMLDPDGDTIAAGAGISLADSSTNTSVNIDLTKDGVYTVQTDTIGGAAQWNRASTVTVVFEHPSTDHAAQTLSVVTANDPPAATISTGGTHTIDALARSVFDPSGLSSLAQVRVTGQPGQGTAVVQGDKSILYTAGTGAAAAGTFDIRYEVYVGESEPGKDDATATVTVEQPNVDPTIQALPDLDRFVGQPVSVTPAATDGNDDDLTYTLGGDPLPNHDFNTGTGELTWVPAAAGTYDVTITVSDGRGGTAPSASFTITVTDAPAFPRPTASYTVTDTGSRLIEIGDGSSHSRTVTLPAGLDRPITGAEVHLDVRHASATDVTARLVAPDGTSVTLTDGTGATGAFAPATYTPFDTPALALLVGLDMAGDWELVVRDTNVNGITGEFSAWSLTVEYEPAGPALGGGRQASITVSHDAADAVTIQTIGAYGEPYDVRVFAPNRTMIHEASGLAEAEVVEAQIAGLTDAGTYVVQTDVASSASKWNTDTSMVATFEHPHATHAPAYPINLDPIITSPVLPAGVGYDSGAARYYALAGQEFTLSLNGTDYDSLDRIPEGAPGNPPRLYWQFDIRPGGSTLGTRDGAFAWTPGAGDRGDNEARVFLRDTNHDDEGEAALRFTITVHEAVQISPVQQTVEAGTPLSYEIPVTNADGVPLTWSITSGAQPGAEVHPNGTLAWVPAVGADAQSPYTFGIRADVGTEAAPGNSHAEGTLEVVVTPSQAPVVTLAPADDPVADPVPYETSVDIDVVGNDAIAPAGTAVTIAPSQPANGMAAALNSTHVTYTPDGGYFGPDSFTYTLSQADGSGSPSEPATVTLTVAPAPGQAQPNGPPAIATIGNQTAMEGVPLQVAFTVTDPDGDALTVALDGLAALAGATFDAASRTLDWPAPAAGSYGLNLTAADAGATSYEFFWVNVGAANAPPAFDEQVGDQAAMTGDLVRVDANATDPEGGTVTYGLGGDALPGHAFSTADGILEWTPQAAGTYGVTITATDPEGASAPLSFTITVTLAGDVRQGMSAAEIAGVIDAAAAGDVVTFSPGTYGDRGAILVTKPLTLEPVGAAVVFSGDTALHVRSDGVTIRGFEFRGVTAPEAIRVSSTAGLTVRDNAFHDSVSGVVVADASTAVDYAALALSADGCRVGTEACPARTGAGSRLTAAPVSSSALVTENTFTGMARYTVANLAAGSLNADRNHHGAGGAVLGGVIVEPWYEDPRRTEPGVLGAAAAGQPGALVRVPDPGSECAPGISSQALDLGNAPWGNASGAGVQEVRATGNRDITEVTVRTTQWAGSGGAYPYSEAVTEARAAGTDWVSTAAPGGATFELDDALEWDDPTDVLRIELRLSLPRQAGPGDGLSQSIEYSVTCR